MADNTDEPESLTDYDPYPTGSYPIKRRSGSEGRRHGDTRYERMKKLATKVSIIVGFITIAGGGFQLIKTLVYVGESAVTLASTIQQVKPAITTLNTRIDSVVIQLGSIQKDQKESYMQLQRASIRDSVQLASLRHTVAALNKTATAIQNKTP